MRKSLFFAAFLVVSLALMVNGSTTGKLDLASKADTDPVRWHKVRFPERDFGYFVGDILTFEIEALVEKGFDLEDKEVLTARLRINEWVERRGTLYVRHGSEADRYLLKVEYQVFYVSEGVGRVRIPGLPLKFVKGESHLTMVIPEFNFSLSALTTEDERKSVAILPDTLPHEPEKSPIVLWGSVFSGATVALMAIAFGPALWRRIRLRKTSPFRKTLREISRARTNREGFEAFHRALNFYARRAVFGHELDKLLSDHPELGEIQGELREFFRASDDIFFVADSADAPILAETKTRLLELARKTMFAERNAGRAGQ